MGPHRAVASPLQGPTPCLVLHPERPSDPKLSFAAVPHFCLRSRKPLGAGWDDGVPIQRLNTTLPQPFGQLNGHPESANSPNLQYHQQWHESYLPPGTWLATLPPLQSQSWPYNILLPAWEVGLHTRPPGRLGSCPSSKFSPGWLRTTSPVGE